MTCTIMVIKIVGMIIVYVVYIMSGKKNTLK